MKTIRILPMLLAVLCASLTASAQRKQCIDANWRFLYGDGRAAVKTPGVTDAWRPLSLPHDWSVEPEAAAAAGGKVIGPFSTNSIGKYQTGHTVGGEGWYYKALDITAADLAGRVALYFEGAYNQSYLYVNGQLCHTNVYGYSSFRQDVTPLLHEGQNHVLVRVVNSGNNTRWYAGSGIYRHVWMIRTGALHADTWDTYVNASANGQISFSTAVHNDGGTAQDGAVEVSICDHSGAELTSGKRTFSALAAGSAQEVSIGINAGQGVSKWSPESPVLYEARVTVRDSRGEVTDRLTRRFGFRSLQFSSTDGFRLNGVPTLLKGGCLHHDNGLLGAAAFDKAERRKLQLLKAQGYNAVRCSHNLPSENFLDVCDELGLMVIDECFDQWLLAKNSDDYHNYFATHSDDDLAVMLRRDRNHPSVIMWSIGNEIPGRVEPSGIATAARLRAGILRYDTTRPVTAAICGWDAGDAWNSAGGDWKVQDAEAFSSLDVGGYNYLFGKYEGDHATHPDRVMCGLESFPKQAGENWALVERLPYVIGDFVWTAVDYLGEAGIGAAYADHNPPMFQGWPWFNGYCGDIDLIGQKKPQSYYRDVVWRQRPVAMAVQPTTSYNNAWGWQLEEQSWTWPGREGQEVDVNVYSRAPRVRLELNGKTVGEGTPGATFWAGFRVAYQPGTLTAVNLDAGGKPVPGETFTLTTTGPVHHVRMVYEDEALTADPNDLAYVTIELVDAEGRVVTSDSQTPLRISNVGAGTLVACGTGSPNDMQSFRSDSLTVWRGRALAIVRSDGTAGKVALEAQICEIPPKRASLLDNTTFEEGGLQSWVISDPNLIRHRGGAWEHDARLSDFLECFVGWGTAGTLAGQYVSQSTKVLPAGQYTLAFDYNGTRYEGGRHYSTTGALTDVTASIGGQSVSIKEISGSQARHAEIQFALTAPRAVSFVIQFGSKTNADWFALDNVELTYGGTYDFGHYIDHTDAVPPFGGGNWAKVPGNASGGYTEAKLASEIYNGEGLAYWSASVPQGMRLFEQATAALPAGTYGLAAFVAANRWTGSDDDRNHQAGTCLFASTSDTNAVTCEVTTATYGLGSLVVDVAEGERLTLGLMADANNGNNWCYLAGLTLVQLDGGDADVPSRIMPPAAVTATAGNGAAYDLAGRRVARQGGRAAGIRIVGGRKVLDR